VTHTEMMGPNDGTVLQNPGLRGKERRKKRKIACKGESVTQKSAPPRKNNSKWPLPNSVIFIETDHNRRGAHSQVNRGQHKGGGWGKFTPSRFRKAIPNRRPPKSKQDDQNEEGGRRGVNGNDGGRIKVSISDTWSLPGEHNRPQPNGCQGANSAYTGKGRGLEDPSNCSYPMFGTRHEWITQEKQQKGRKKKKGEKKRMGGEKALIMGRKSVQKLSARI